MFDPVLLLAVALAGGLGAVIRLFVGRWRGRLPWGILLANTLAGLILAFLQMISLQIDDRFLFAVVFVGLCGGLSTYSSVAADTGNYLKDRAYGKAVANLAANLGIPLVAYLLPVALLANLVN
jgi:CrcB protein